jgi:hypothetical protein
VVENSTHNPNIDVLNPAAGAEREKMAKEFKNKGSVESTQWHKTRLIIHSLRVCILLLAPEER